MGGLEFARAREDFDAGRLRAFWRSLAAVMTRRGRSLLTMDEVLEAARQEGRSERGEREINVDRIVGTAASGTKAGEFDDAFLPVDRRLRDRWQRIYQQMTEGDELPPIDVYQIGDSYFVSDGHRRVSVSRSLGRKTIKARVVEVRTRAPVPAGLDAGDLLRMAEYAAFLEETRLDRTRPEARLEVSRLGRYDHLMSHVAGHRYFLSLERGSQVPLAEAAASWYDNVYVPVRDLLRRHDLLSLLPGSTEVDAYAEVTKRWLLLSHSRGPGGPHAAVHALAAERAGRWWRRGTVLRHLRRLLLRAQKTVVDNPSSGS